MNRTINTPTKSFQRIRFCALAGTQAEIDGRVIVGKWKQPRFFYSPSGRLLLEDFLNWPSDNGSILRFVTKYGPLTEKPDTREDFKVNLSMWANWKKVWCHRWEDLMGASGNFEFATGLDGAGLQCVNGQFEFIADCLDTFLLLELASSDRKRLRKCPAPDCDTPYFIARHARQKYCGGQCAQWAQKIWKQNWWKSEGPKWRAKRAKMTEMRL